MDKALGKVGAQPEKKTDLGYVPFVKRVYGQTQTWKSDIEDRRNGDQAEYDNQVNGGLNAQAEHVMELGKEIIKLQKAAKANKELQAQLRSNAEEEGFDLTKDAGGGN